METLTYEKINQWQAEYIHNPVQQAMRHAVFNNPIEQCVLVQENMTKNQNHFSVEIQTLKAADQLTSGRCWIFAGLNILREEIAKRNNMNRFELSQNYIAFYDKLEKIHTFIQYAIAMKETVMDDRTYVWLLTNGIQDGGQWDMFVNLVKKYGIVPKDYMPETYQSSNTAVMNQLLNTRLRKFAQEVRSLAALHKEDEIIILKETVMKEMYGFLCTCFGIPPKQFAFSFADKDGDVHHLPEMTPQEFYRDQISIDLEDYISIIHAPTKDKPFHQVFQVKYLDHAGGKGVRYLNVEMAEMKEAVIRQLKAGYLVWFGSDCNQFNDKKGGFWDDASFDYQHAFEIDFSIDKETALNMRNSTMNHAMVLSGVDLIDDQPIKWKIENSWGSSTGHNGYFIASDSWFERFVYQCVVHKRYLTTALLADLQKEPKLLDPWDPMGALAQ